jgi:thiamine-monophosphate kinase
LKAASETIEAAFLFFVTQSFTTIESVGRDHLIARFAQRPFATGIGDDAAVIPISEERLLLVSTESFTEGVDFDLTFTPFQHLGFKLCSAAVGDILAMNGLPTYVFVNLSIPNRISIEMTDQLYDGIGRACGHYGMRLAGGDVTATSGALGITVTVLGETGTEQVVRRSGARVGDAICVSGDLGAAFAGLQVLLREKRYWNDRGDDSVQPDLTAYESVIRRQLAPEAPQDLIRVFHDHKIRPTAMIDVSKHVLRELLQLAEGSSVGFFVYAAALPIALDTRHVADEFEEDVDRYAMQGGEDHQLLFTITEADLARLMKAYPDVTVIGKTVPASEGVRMQTADGEIVSFDPNE